MESVLINGREYSFPPGAKFLDVTDNIEYLLKNRHGDKKYPVLKITLIV